MKKRKARYLKLVCLGVLGTYAGASYYNSEPLIAQEETETSHESRQLVLEEKRADQVNQDQGTLTSSTLNETVISSSEQQESSIQNDSGDHQENNMEPSESENSLPPQEKPIASTKPTESLQSEQPASEERKALTEKPPHNQEPQNSTLTEKTKEPLVHSEIDNSQEKEKQAGIQQQAEANFVVQENTSTSEFIRKIGEEARVIGQRHDLYASVMIAQAILESGSGNSALAAPPNYNLFGIKGAYQGQSVSFSTQEDDGKGKMTTIHADFRQYPSYKESLTDYSKLIINGLAGNPTFYHGVLKANTTNYQQATKFLTGRYATDTYYDKKLNALIETYQLTEYDQEKKKPVVTNLAEEKKPSFDKEAVKEQLKKEAVIYEVSKGDSLATISQTFGVSATAILKQNLKTQEMFYVGQKITIPQHTAATSLEPKEQALLQSLIISKSVTNALETAEQSNGTANDSKTASTEYYEVKRGETLAKIAKKTGYSLNALKQENDLTYSVLTEGQTIALPKLKD
ncbi:glucosaminidase domain-containing protein [Enterococcus faecalis]|uniref:glucosaminidase domain-containing protein n=1 Tax=Enterococcus faecalis TaxID=1351 RepID=UPI00177F953E|nr:glucosaminidase domain-containing protein [Enterococcus faecalis]MBD9893393.1 glucosaminidase domain-containing protein [Enterococcus faecalis]MDJ9022405.1 glucosaminidase domain-containing protein [Enterococcus faecalis]MDK0467027.1 glucosaminidase domain-containing protein [Enterococcus faecalis]